jgi:putative copper resistance protein D
MSTVEGLLIATRAIHFGAAVVLFGEMLFAWFFAPSRDSASLLRGRASDSSEPRFLRVAVAAWACMAVSGAGWFAMVSMQMSGRSLGALDRATIAAVLGSTIFGRAWLVRTVLALALAGMWPILFAKTAPPRRWALVAMVISGALLASLAWSGHANAEVGPNSVVHHLSDSVHLLAAGAWLGGLAPLAALLRQADALPNDRAFTKCAETVTRFGNAAAICVATLVMTGLVNAYYLLPELSSLLETTYGRVLLLKICAFLIMLAIAAVNRNRLTPALNPSSECHSARTVTARALRRNVFLEQILGAVVLLLVAALGVSPPPMRM